MEIYIATFAALLSTLLLAVVYLADRYEREPVELIQDFFLSGLLGQLLPIVATSTLAGDVLWSGPWIFVTLVGAALYLPFRLHRQAEMDERFDGIVYTVALVGGAVCVIHLNNLPRLIAASPYHEVLASGSAPDLRDLLIIATWPGFTAELGQGLVLISAATLIGGLLGTLQMRGVQPWKTVLAALAVAIATTGLDLATGGVWPVRGGLAAAAVAVALAIKRRSVFRDRPEPPERDALILAVKSVLMVFGAALLAAVLLQSVAEHAEVADPPGHGSELNQMDSGP